jgi:hypothetical protein
VNQFEARGHFASRESNRERTVDSAIAKPDDVVEEILVDFATKMLIEAERH